MSRKILDQALEQQDELEAEYGGTTVKKDKKSLSKAKTSLGNTGRSGKVDSDTDSDSDEDQFSEEEDQYYEDVVRITLSIYTAAPYFIILRC